ncbi:MAG: LysR family transcriptional regulator [Thalassobium sp.]|nr:MAG: LysR family transcriptional regulator [Thalassobium sp.]
MTGTHPSLKWLSTFRAIAQCGSVQATAAQTQQSVSTVSHQLQSLEKHLGIALMDHHCRPMVLTPQGAIYLRHVEEVFKLLDQAKGDLISTVPDGLRHLRFAMIDDFEDDVGPAVTRLLTQALPTCRVTHYTRTSHDILALLRNRELDIAVATQPQSPLPEVAEYPVLRDPFVLAAPAAFTGTGEDLIGGQSGLPFLRYMRSQIMGGQIEAQLTRLGLKLPNQFEFDSTASILALVAQNSGWAITTPSNYARSKQFQGGVRLIPFPRKGFARTISMFVAAPHLADLAQTIGATLRSQLATHSIGPITEAHPWLVDGYRLITD